MMKRFSLIVVVLSLVDVPGRAAAWSGAEQRLRSEIRSALEQDTLRYLYEADSSTEEPPLSPETRKVLIRGAYSVIAGALASRGIYISEYQFNQKMFKLLDGMAALGLFPHALTVGYMARYQAGIGGSIGTQFNFFIEKGDLKVSSYSMFGLQAGVAAQARVQFYAGACFGSCFGGDPTGWYVGTDVSASMGIGVDGFLEFGVDVSEALQAAALGERVSFADLWDSRAVYAGVGLDVGFGGGWTADVFHYRMDFTRTLWKGSEHLGEEIPLSVLQRYPLRVRPK